MGHVSLAGAQVNRESSGNDTCDCGVWIIPSGVHVTSWAATGSDGRTCSCRKHKGVRLRLVLTGICSLADHSQYFFQ